jgi:lysine-N-methylase
MQRACGLAPEVVGDDHRMFLPIAGVVDRRSLAVTMTDGQCPFLSKARCTLHERGGTNGKPLGCRVFPNSYADDGEAVRVSVQLECPCVVKSGVMKSSDEGEPLVAPGAKEGDLDRRVHITRIPERVVLGDDADALRRELRPWSEAIADAEIVDGVAACWALADAVDAHGLAPDAASRAAACAEPPRPDALRAHLSRLAEIAADRAEGAADRKPSDRVRVLSAWTARAADTLTEDEAVRARSSGVPDPAREAFYLRAIAWGHHLASGRLPLARGLRDRAIRLLLARQMTPEVDPDHALVAEDPAADYPITAVETMMRARALEAYAYGVR